jgi:hypothetical protein
VYNLAQVVPTRAFYQVFLCQPLIQEELPDLLLSNHDAFFIKLNLPPPLSAAAAAATSSISTALPAVVPVTSPKIVSKKAPTKVPVVASPLCSPPSTPRLKAAAAAASSEEGTAVVDSKSETTIGEVAIVNEEAASSMDMQCNIPSAAGDLGLPSVEAQD